MKPIATAALILSVAASAQAQVAVSGAWVRATVPAQKSSGAFMRLESPVAARLVAVSTPVASSAALHHMKMDGGAMQMREVDAIALEAGVALDFGASGYHVMLGGLKRQLKAGETVPLVLVFTDAAGRRRTQQALAQVMPIGTAAKR